MTCGVAKPLGCLSKSRGSIDVTEKGTFRALGIVSGLAVIHPQPVPRTTNRHTMPRIY
jgi:hypothetical protein